MNSGEGTICKRKTDRRGYGLETGTGVASVMSVDIYDLTGASLANGAYIYVIYATDGTNSFTDKGKVFVNR